MCNTFSHCKNELVHFNIAMYQSMCQNIGDNMAGAIQIQHVVAFMKKEPIHISDSDNENMKRSRRNGKGLSILQACYQIFKVHLLFSFSEQYPKHIDGLVQQCMEWCDSFHLPLLVPLTSWLPDPRTPLLLTLDQGTERVTIICATLNGQHLFCASDTSDIKMFHVPSKTLVKTFTGKLIYLITNYLHVEASFRYR